MLQAAEVRERELEAEAVVKYEQREKVGGAADLGDRADLTVMWKHVETEAFSFKKMKESTWSRWMTCVKSVSSIQTFPLRTTSMGVSVSKTFLSNLEHHGWCFHHDPTSSSAFGQRGLPPWSSGTAPRSCCFQPLRPPKRNEKRRLLLGATRETMPCKRPNGRREDLTYLINLNMPLRYPKIPENHNWEMLLTCFSQKHFRCLGFPSVC